MKVKSLRLKHFKRFRETPELDFAEAKTGLARDLIVLTGMNASGKTSILQAIAATLGVATGRLDTVSELQWPGFNYELSSNCWGRFEPEVTVEVQFGNDEIESVNEFHGELAQLGRNLPVAPAKKPSVTLRWQDGRVIADTAAELFQFRGREYAKQLLRSRDYGVFERVGTILWYTEQRTSTSLTPEDFKNSLDITDDVLRDRLSKWRQFHKQIEEGLITKFRPGQKDLYYEIEKNYKRVFPERGFEGPVPRENIDDILEEPWFFLFDGRNQYEISEMSGGERAVFPMIVDFANWNVHNSVILVDEIELHLHPPMQQALLRALPRMGKNNQFIITTHSDYVEQLLPKENIIHID